MASKRPREQQPGVVDEMANAIVRQVKAQRIVTTKGPVYACRWWCLSTEVPPYGGTTFLNANRGISNIPLTTLRTQPLRPLPPVTLLGWARERRPRASRVRY